MRLFVQFLPVCFNVRRGEEEKRVPPCLRGPPPFTDASNRVATFPELTLIYFAPMHKHTHCERFLGCSFAKRRRRRFGVLETPA